jgi:EAL domain-containing protein (putative c-di-GMP-specific phosphodiesterase class I)
MRGNRHFRELEELHAIIANTSLEPVFQPILQLNSGEIFGYEGQVRDAQGK